MTYKNPDILKEELKERGKWYCKGFGDLLGAVRNNLHIYSSDQYDLSEQEKRKRRERKLYPPVS